MSADDGMLQRLVFAVPGRQLAGQDRRPDGVAIARYEAIIRALSAFHPPTGPIKEFSDHIVLHADAHKHREEVDAIARALVAMPDTSPRMISTLGKIPGQFARICLTFHMINLVDANLADAPSPYLQVVPEATAMRAAAFMREIVIPHLYRAHAVMFSSAQTTHAQWIAGYILAHKLDRITSRDVAKAYRPLRPPECKSELADVMASLATVGWIEPIVPANTAKPVWSWDVNPHVHTIFSDRAERERQAREQAKADIAADVAVLRRQRDSAKHDA